MERPMDDGERIADSTAHAFNGAIVPLSKAEQIRACKRLLKTTRETLEQLEREISWWPN